MIIPQKLAIIFIEQIVSQYIREYDKKKNSSHFLTQASRYIDNSFDISWSGGGSRGSCYDTKGPEKFESDEEPDMEELDNFLQENFPSLDRIEIFELKNMCDINTTYDSDYYGGRSCSHSKGISFDSIAEFITPLLYSDDYEHVNFQDILEDIAPYVANITENDCKNIILKIRLDEKLEKSNLVIKKIKI